MIMLVQPTVGLVPYLEPSQQLLACRCGHDAMTSFLLSRRSARPTQERSGRASRLPIDEHNRGCSAAITAKKYDEEDVPSKPLIDSSIEATLIGMIQWYKDTLSPLMQPRCRFYPTCSSYGIASIKEFGPVKGLILTAWRILRCNPVGGKGYDPPQWPPPSWFAGLPMTRALFDRQNATKGEQEQRSTGQT